MKHQTKQLLRIGVLALTLGAFNAARGETQFEKNPPGAGDDIATAEIFDCHMDKWICTHNTSGDVDLLCFYWKGGFFQCKGVKVGGGGNCGIMLLAENGDCWGEVNDHADGSEETLTISFLPKGCYYLYCGWYDCGAYHNVTDYNNEANVYCRPGAHSFVSGPLYKCRINTGNQATAGHQYQCCFVNYEHPGKPMQLDATCGKTRNSSDSVGNGRKNESGAGQQVKVMKKGRKAICYFQCKSEEATRAATGIKITGVSTRKYRQKFIDVTGGGNITAEIRKGDFCKNYNPGFCQIIKCQFKAKGLAKRRETKDTAKFKCDSACGEYRDTAKCRFYTKFRG